MLLVLRYVLNVLRGNGVQRGDIFSGGHAQQLSRAVGTLEVGQFEVMY